MPEPSTAGRARPCPWNIADILKVFALYFLMMGVGSAMLLAIARRLLGDDPFALYGTNTVALVLSLLTNGLSCLFIIYIVSIRHRQPVSTLGITLMDWQKNLSRGLVRYMVILPVIVTVGFLVELMTKSMGITPHHQEVVLRFLGERSYLGMVAIIAFGTLVGPVAEEVLFRGFLQPALRDVMGSTRAIVVTSLLFALVHFNAYIFPQIFILGLLLGYLYEETGTLVAPVSVHVLHNSVSLTVLLWIKQSGGLL